MYSYVCSSRKLLPIRVMVTPFATFAMREVVAATVTIILAATQVLYAPAIHAPVAAVAVWTSGLLDVVARRLRQRASAGTLATIEAG